VEKCILLRGKAQERGKKGKRGKRGKLKGDYKDKEKD
jgi:hypothetical protein